MTRTLITLTTWSFIQILFQAFYPPTITGTYIATGALGLLTIISTTIDLIKPKPTPSNYKPSNYKPSITKQIGQLLKDGKKHTLTTKDVDELLAEMGIQNEPPRIKHK